MKKLLSLIIAVCIFVSAFVVTTSATDTLTSMEKSILKLENADADKDGTVDLEDAKAYLLVAAGIAAENESYDVDLDGTTSLADAVAVLNESAGVKHILSTEEALELFNNRVNLIKSLEKQADGETPVEGAFPGFEKTTTMKCNSMLITTTGAPAIVSKLNVKNMEYRDYVDVVVKTMNTFSAFMDEAMIAQLEEMKETKVTAYEPKSNVETAAKGVDVDHISLYPISNNASASRLTVGDVSSVTCEYKNHYLVYTVTMGTKTYVGNEYPTGTTGYSSRLNLAYGKVFNIMSFDESDGSTLNSVTYKDGKVTLYEHKPTGMLTESHYSYTYVSDISAPPQDGINMRTTMTSDVKEDFIFDNSII